MNWIKRLYGNHIFATLCLCLMLAVGAFHYRTMPTEQNPSIKFNWILVNTLYPGAAPEDIEKSVTVPLEDAIRKLSDLRFVVSTSRDSISTILLRFESVSDEVYQERMNDLRREVQRAERLLPPDIIDPDIVEVNSSNAFASATLMVMGHANDTHLRQVSKNVKDDLQRLAGVDAIRTTGLRETELQVLFDPNKLIAAGLNPLDVANTVQKYTQDLAAGTVHVDGERLLVRWEGAIPDPDYVAQLPILTAQGEIPLTHLADVQWGLEKPHELASYNGRPGILLSILKEEKGDILKLIHGVEDYIDTFNKQNEGLGIELVLVNDTREMTENALGIMETNALYGLLLVLLVTWVFLGTEMAVLISIGIPFSLAGAFWGLDALGYTLNISVLLGVVIALGMLVDDAVVVMESIHYHLSRIPDTLEAVVASLRETFTPVTTSVLTTLCAFLPLMLLPGILGEFMKVVPMVVTLALVISLLEAFWLLPAHVYSLYQGRETFGDASIDRKHWRERLTRRIRQRYTRSLIRVFRKPKRVLGSMLGLVALVVLLLATNAVKTDFFASDPMRMFFINVDLSAKNSIHDTLEQGEILSRVAQQFLPDEDTQGVAVYAGMQVTQTEIRQGDNLGQIFVSLYPQRTKGASVDELVTRIRDAFIQEGVYSDAVSFTTVKDGPPSEPPIKVSVRGDRFDDIGAAVEDLRRHIATIPGAHDLQDDSILGQRVMVVHPDTHGIHRNGLTPDYVMNTLRLFVDGQVVGYVNENGEKLNVRVRSNTDRYTTPADLLNQTVFVENKAATQLRYLVDVQEQSAPATIRHYNFRRSITVTAELDGEQNNALNATKSIEAAWENLQKRHPGIDIVLSGELDDIKESLDAMPGLFLLGVGLMYLILGTQFRSYFQPLLIITTIPMAFIGVILGLLVTGHALSLYTLYGVVALSGIAVNAAIVLISAANERLEDGFTVVMATLFAAKRRVVPILITTSTTIAGLFSLAIGLGGQSALWGPVATAIVSGLFFSTLLSLYLLPFLYCYFMGGMRLSSLLEKK